MKKLTVIGIAAVLLAGCFPGEAEFTMKTSEVRKALNGEVARISVHEQMTTVLSNAYAGVSFGIYTNKLQVVKALAKDLELSEANDTVKVWVEEKTNALPCVKLDAQIGIALGTTNCLARYAESCRSDELCALAIDPADGRISGSGIYGDDQPVPGHNRRSAAIWSAWLTHHEVVTKLFGDNDEMASVANSLHAVMLPTWFQNLSCVVVGDSDEPLYVIAEDAKVNGKAMAHFEGYVKKGETVRFELNKRLHMEDGGMRFLLAKPEAGR